MTPIQALTGIKPNVCSLRRFGWVVVVNIPSQFRSGKLGGAYHVFIPESGRILFSLDVKMIEELAGHQDRALVELEETYYLSTGPSKADETGMAPVPIRKTVTIRQNQLDALTHFPEVRRSGRMVQPPIRYGEK